MTGGRVIVLGETGKNFAAGMSVESLMSSKTVLTLLKDVIQSWLT